jgi:hypothetical protein
MFWRRLRALSKDTRASSPARLRLSSVRSSLVCAPLTEASAQMLMPHVGAGMTASSTWSR